MRLDVVRNCVLLAATLLAGCEFGIEGTPPPGTNYPHAQSSSGGRISGGHLSFVSSYEQGFRQAATAGKPMLVFFTAPWCKFCHQMADEAFTHPQVVSLSSHFVCILVDADAEPAVCRQFSVTGFPTIQFLSARGTPLERIVGKKPGHQLMMAMQAALQSVARKADELEAPVRSSSRRAPEPSASRAIEVGSSRASSGLLSLMTQANDHCHE
jgi:thioredoxin-like negative regulator of GroEL